MKNILFSKLLTHRSVVIILILAATLFGLFFRTVHLNTVPVSISYDQLDHAINGLGIRYTGRDFENQHYFWELMPVSTHTFTAELGGVWHAVTPQLEMMPIAQAKLPNVFFGFVFVTALTAFSYQVFKSKRVTVLTFILILLSPWHIYISRTGYEAPNALALMMVSIVCFWQYFDHEGKVGKVLLLTTATLSMLGSFYTYHGYKMIFPLIFIAIFTWKNIKYLKKLPRSKQLVFRMSPLVLLLTAWLIVFLIFLFRIQASAYGDRSGEISFLNEMLLSSIVNSERQESLTSPLKAVFANKATALFTLASKNFAGAADFKMLFISGFDESFALGLWAHGFLYLVQAPLIAIGAYWLWKNYRGNAPYFFLLIVVSLVPVLIHTGVSVTLRSSLYIPLLIILSALGIEALIKSHFKGKSLILLLLAGGITLSVLNFYYFYTVRYPVYAVDASMLDKRILSSYLTRHLDSDRQIKILTIEPYNTARMFAFLSGILNEETVKSFQAAIPDAGALNISFDNYSFSSECAHYFPTDKETIIAEPSFVKECNLEEKIASLSAQADQESTDSSVLILPSPRDNRDYYRIYQDTLCRGEQVPNFITIQDLRLYNLEKLTNHDYCTNWARKVKI